MAFNIRSIMSPGMRGRIDTSTTEMARLHALPDRWLGQEILRLARAARTLHPAELGTPGGMTYGVNLVWQIAPEAARRLGVTNLSPNEATDPEVRMASPEEFRQMIGQYIAHSSLDRLDNIRRRDLGTCDTDTRPGPGEMLCHEACNGNPLAMAADRISAPPAPGCDRDDPIARSLREISVRRGFAETPFWSPALSKTSSTDPEPELAVEGIRPIGMR